MRKARVAVLASAVAALATIAVTERPASALSGTGGGTCHTVCNTTPGYVPGAHSGDIVFNNYNGDDNPGPITTFLHSLGLQRTHTGIMLDPSWVRHNSMSATFLKNNVAKPSPLSTEPGSVYIWESALKSSGPGLHSANLADEDDPDSSTYDPEWHDVTLLTAKDETTSRTRATNAANYLNSVNMGYGLYAYSNFWDALNRDSTSMCSGSVYLAWYVTDASRGGFSLTTQSEATRDDDADKLFNAILVSASDTKTYTWDWDVFESQYRYLDVYWSIGPQIVNAMAFGKFKDFDQNWKIYMSTGTSISPDDLATEGTVCSVYYYNGFPIRHCAPSDARAYNVYETSVTPVPTSTTCKVVCL